MNRQPDGLAPDAGFALVTGANSGIGEALAEALAARGWPLILAARNDNRLDSVAKRLRGAGVHVETLTADLAAVRGPAGLAEAIQGRGWHVALLINNAGLGSAGDFARLPFGREAEMIAVNVAAVGILTHSFLPAMIAAGRGAVINISSAAAFQPIPYMATYAASKAFELHFSLALWRENRHRGVHVMAVCPGTTATRFFESAGIPPRRRMHSPAQVAAWALRGLDRRRPLVLCGWQYRALVATQRLVPRRAVIAMASRFAGRRSGGGNDS